MELFPLHRTDSTHTHTHTHCKKVVKPEILMLISTIRPNVRFDHRHPSSDRSGLVIITPKHIPKFARASRNCPVHVRGVSFSILTISRKVVLFFCHFIVLICDKVYVAMSVRLRVVDMLQTGESRREVPIS